jgi:hypothetical protein
MPSESIGTCGYQSSESDWAKSQLALGICYIRQACGEPPQGYKLAIIWNEHELGSYPTIGIQWDGPFDPPWNYISKAAAALETFDEAVDWGAIQPKDEEDSGDESPDNYEGDDDSTDEATGELQSDTETIEIYRREEKVQIQLADWTMALLILQEMGWSPDRPFETFARPLAFVTAEQAQAMSTAGRSLFAAIQNEPILSVSITMDLGILYTITEFVGDGAFIVGRIGAHAEAIRNGDFS